MNTIATIDNEPAGSPFATAYRTALIARLARVAFQIEAEERRLAPIPEYRLRLLIEYHEGMVELLASSAPWCAAAQQKTREEQAAHTARLVELWAELAQLEGGA